MIPIATARELAGAVRLAYCLPSVFYLKCDFRLPKTLHQETETARAHTVRLAARPPQKHREPQTCTRARKVRRSKRPRNAKPEETETRIKGPRQPKSKNARAARAPPVPRSVSQPGKPAWGAGAGGSRHVVHMSHFVLLRFYCTVLLLLVNV